MSPIGGTGRDLSHVAVRLFEAIENLPAAGEVADVAQPAATAPA